MSPTGAAGSGPLRLGYYQYDADSVLTCPDCSWQGRAGDHHTVHDELLDIRCPDCDELLAVVVYPTLDETREAAAAGNQQAVKDLPGFEAQAAARRESASTLLTDPAQLPELDGDELVLTWELDGDQVLLHGDRVIWREHAYYESYQRFAEIFELLRQRYGKRFKGLQPTLHSETWLYGDRLGAPAKVDALNRSVKQ